MIVKTSQVFYQGFMKEITNYKLIKTADESFTLYSERFDEACHSLEGARGETYFNFIEGCELSKKLLHQEFVNILEIGFGAGVGLSTTLDFFQSYIPKKKLHFISTEIDPELAKWSLKNISSHNSNFPQIEEVVLYESDGLTYYYGEKNESSLLILIGDARLTIKEAQKRNLIPPLSAIYQDAFSPKKNPTLWTWQWFTLLKELSQKEAIMSTYSASTSVRKAMVKGGWKIQNRPGFGKKKSSTKAFLFGESDTDTITKLNFSSVQPLDDFFLL